jgi:hypothetical protein
MLVLLQLVGMATVLLVECIWAGSPGAVGGGTLDGAAGCVSGLD